MRYASQMVELANVVKGFRRDVKTPSLASPSTMQYLHNKRNQEETPR